MEEEQGIYRGEVATMMIALADIDVNVRKLLEYFREDDDGEEEEDLPDA